MDLFEFPPQYEAGTIVTYEIKPEIQAGKMEENLHRYDLLSIVMIGLSAESFAVKETPLHGLLGTVFSEELMPEEKLKILNDDYGIIAAKEVEEGMKHVCNLSDAIEERGIEKGIAALVVTCKSFNCTREEVMRRLRTMYDFDNDEAAMEKVNLYW